MKQRLCLFVILFITLPLFAQTGQWRAELHREDGHAIVFCFEWKQEAGKSLWFIQNAEERIKVDNIVQKGDSFLVEMPVFESQFRLIYREDHLQGLWIKAGATRTQTMPFTAERDKPRFPLSNKPSLHLADRWELQLGTDPPKLALAEWKQKGSVVTGSVLTPSGDYRYLEGGIKDDSLFLSTFDGSFALFFTARIKDSVNLEGGTFYSGARNKVRWQAQKKPKALLSKEEVAMHLRPGASATLDFSFPDLDGQTVSIRDKRFQEKVVVVQITGSWCPNCIDETAYYAPYYLQSKQRGVEFVALAYEYTTDNERSRKSLRKLQQRFDVQYPMLLTGVKASDSLKTEKTLPQLTPIKMFPSTIILDKKGKVRKIETGFSGPATGIHFLEYKREFEATIEELLRE